MREITPIYRTWREKIRYSRSTFAGAGPSQGAGVETKVPAMQQRYLGLFAVALMACVACAESSPGEVKSPDQILAEQEALGDEQLKKERASSGSRDTSG